jgi:hypothetical protein
MTEERFPCPNCGEPVSTDDVYCRKCGVNLTEFSQKASVTAPSEPVGLPEEPYERNSLYFKGFTNF